MRDPFETTVGADSKSLLGYGGALAAPSTAYLYNWNTLPIGQLLWLKELESYTAFPPILQEVKQNGHRHPSE
jgi:arylsulfatase